jgi:CheY-like chemotaxis protein
MDHRGMIMAQVGLALEGAASTGRILLVEDDGLVGLDMKTTLEGAGYDVLGPVATLAAALAVITATKLDAALLDVNLSGEKSYALADALTARGIPFIITTGYSIDDLPDRYGQDLVLSKPFSPKDLLRCLREAMVLREDQTARVSSG